MGFFTFKIDQKIKDNSLEFQSMVDKNKADSFINIAKDRSKRVEDLKNFEIHPKERVYNIPYEALQILHQDNAVVGFDGSIFIHGEYFKSEVKHKKIMENMYSYVEKLSFFSIRNIRDIKNFLKKIYFSFFSTKAYRNRKIFNNPNITKILFFETAYDNMYHFLFQYYSSLHVLIEYCKNQNLDYYIIMPPKCNRGLRSKYFYSGYINDIIKAENISTNKLLFLDYQNYRVSNILYTNFPIDNPRLYIPTVTRIQSYFYDPNYKIKNTRFYISRKKAVRRFLINEEEIKKILEKEYGFTTIYMEDCTLYEKINMMLRAEIVVSVDGTSLLNGYFSKSKAVKLIAFRVHDMTEWNAIISAMFDNLEYLPIMASVANQKKHDNYNNIWYRSDLYLDTNYLRQKLRDYEVFPILNTE